MYFNIKFVEFIKVFIKKKQNKKKLYNIKTSTILFGHF